MSNVPNLPKYNVYVGARYVPIMGGEWSNAKEYEPLVVVTHEGNSYTSNTFVPVGIDISNTDYWTLTGNYNAQVESYRKEVEELKNAIEYSFVYVDDFGAVGDGVTDDTAAFKRAIEYCNANNFILKTKGKNYAVSSQDIQVYCSIDFNGATITLTGNTSSNNRFMSITDPNKVDYTLTQSILMPNKILDERMWGKTVTIISPLSMGQRYGTGNNIFYEMLVVVDNDGNFITEKYNPEIINGSYRYIEVKDIDEKPLFIKNVNIRFNSTTTYLATFAHIVRNNVTIENVNVEGTVDNTNTHEGIFYCHSCFNLEFNNINGYNPFSTTVAGYIIDIYDCDTVRINNFNVISKEGGSWPALAAQFCNNVEYNQCHTDRLDMHFSGTYRAKNCVLHYASFSHGYGNVILDNCILYGDAKNHAVYFRGDLSLPLNGSIIMKNCKIIPYGGRDCFRFYNNLPIPSEYANFNQTGLKILIDNCDLTGTAFGAYLNGVNYQDRTMTEIEVRNTRARVNTLVATPRGNVDMQYRFKNVLIDNVDFVTTNNGYIHDGGYMGCVTIQNCNLTGYPLNINCATGIFKIVKNNFTALNHTGTWFNIITDNTVETDVAPGLPSSVTRQIIDNNIITASGSSHQADWLNKKPS